MKPRDILEIFLGILTAMGGFVEIGELVFTVNAGAKFGFRLLWVALLGTVGIIVYGEMAGRVAAVTHKPVFDIIRDATGPKLGAVTLIAANIVNVLTCAAEIGGLAIVLKLLFGSNYFLMVLVAGVFIGLVTWFLDLDWIERIFGLLGLMMVVFMVTAVTSVHDWNALMGGLIPSLPAADTAMDYANYAYFGVAMLSSIMLPYEVYFYSSGAIEDQWTTDDIPTNRIVVVIGFALGGLLCAALLIDGAQLFLPRLLEPQLPGTAALAPAMLYGKVGLLIALGGMFFAFGGAAIETALSSAYNLCQFLRWPWGKTVRPTVFPRFTATWVIVLLLAVLIMLTGADPISVVEYSIIFAVVIMPLTFYPILRTANDFRIMGQYVNKPFAKVLGWFFFVLLTIAALAALPLMFITHSGKA
ncbi:MAG: Nramp family divalent metal transporter [Pyrinomonadaceae bacterium]